MKTRYQSKIESDCYSLKCLSSSYSRVDIPRQLRDCSVKKMTVRKRKTTRYYQVIMSKSEKTLINSTRSFTIIQHFNLTGRSDHFMKECHTCTYMYIFTYPFDSDTHCLMSDIDVHVYVFCWAMQLGHLGYCVYKELSHSFES